MVRGTVRVVMRLWDSSYIMSGQFQVGVHHNMMSNMINYWPAVTVIVARLWTVYHLVTGYFCAWATTCQSGNTTNNFSIFSCGISLEHFVTDVGGRLTRVWTIFQVQFLWQKTNLLYSSCIYRLLTYALMDRMSE